MIGWLRFLNLFDLIYRNQLITQLSFSIDFFRVIWKSRRRIWNKELSCSKHYVVCLLQQKTLRKIQMFQVLVNFWDSFLDINLPKRSNKMINLLTNVDWLHFKVVNQQKVWNSIAKRMNLLLQKLLYWMR